MDAETKAAYENEIAQLKRTIAVLLNYNEHLQQQLAQSGISSSPPGTQKSPFLSENDLLHPPPSISEKGNDLPHASIATTEKGNGNTHSPITTTEKGNDNTGAWRPVSEKGNGNTNNTISISETESGNSDVLKAISEKGNGNTQKPKALPEKIDPSGGNPYMMVKVFRRPEYRGLKKSGRLNAARLLIHFHNKGGGTHSELVKLTGLSASGLAKFIMTLKKRGLITRSGYQQFRPSILGTQLLTEVFGV